MSSEVNRNINMMFKTIDLSLRAVTTLEDIINDALKYLNSDPSARLIRKELKQNSELSFCACKPYQTAELSKRLTQNGIPHLVSASVSIEGAHLIIFTDKHDREVEQILGEFRATHNRGGLTTKEVIAGQSQGNLCRIDGLSFYEGALMVEQAEKLGVNIAVEGTGKDTYAIVFNRTDMKSINNMRITTALQVSDKESFEALKKQIDFEDNKTMNLANEAMLYDKNDRYYLIDIKGTEMEITADKITHKESGGIETVIDNDDFRRNEKVYSLAGSLKNPVRLSEEQYKEFKSLNKESQLKMLIQLDKELGRPSLTQEEYEAVRKMEDSRILYEQKLAQDNPEQEILQYSFTNNEMRMSEFEEAEKINEEAVHDRSAGYDLDMDLYDDARSKCRGYAIKEEELTMEQQEYAEHILDNELDEHDFEQFADENDLAFEDLNANMIPDDLEVNDLYDND